jgi:hypothetical protein
VQFVGADQQLGAVHLGRGGRGDQHGDLVAGSEPCECRQRRRRGALGEDLVVGAEAAAQLAGERLQPGCVVVDQEEQRFPHARNSLGQLRTAHPPAPMRTLHPHVSTFGA